jgi:hypothetical protein
MGINEILEDGRTGLFVQVVLLLCGMLAVEW